MANASPLHLVLAFSFWAPAVQLMSSQKARDISPRALGPGQRWSHRWGGGAPNESLLPALGLPCPESGWAEKTDWDGLWGQLCLAIS